MNSSIHIWWNALLVCNYGNVSKNKDVTICKNIKLDKDGYMSSIVNCIFATNVLKIFF